MAKSCCMLGALCREGVVDSVISFVGVAVREYIVRSCMLKNHHCLKSDS